MPREPSYGSMQTNVFAVTRPSYELRAFSLSKTQCLSRYVARLLDVSIAGLLLVSLAPLMAVLALLVRATSPGPALFRQTRIGYLEKPFVIFKFRTMYDKSDDRVHREYVSRMLLDRQHAQRGPNGLFKLGQDPRITRIGHFLRRTSLDELPQLINVLRGEMALVGPRPALPWEVKLYTQEHRIRFQVKPGMTGLWQVRGRSRLDMNEALDLDMQYVQRCSLALNLWILAMTLPALFRGGAQ
jgi:lipopolysaccharide/colanic/teichoic acid biosynthesis glycosyltransferase